MVSAGNEVKAAREALSRARTWLHGRLSQQPAWRALSQLEQREAGSDPVAAVSRSELHARLAAQLDGYEPDWRLLKGIETALAALEGAEAALPVNPRVAARPDPAGPPAAADEVARATAPEEASDIESVLKRIRTIGTAASDRQPQPPPAPQPVPQPVPQHRHWPDASLPAGSAPGADERSPWDGPLARAGVAGVRAGFQPLEPESHDPPSTSRAGDRSGPAATATLVAGSPAPGAARIDDLESEVERLMQHGSTRGEAPPPAEPPAASRAAPALSGTGAITSDGLEEAEVSIVSTGPDEARPRAARPSPQPASGERPLRPSGPETELEAALLAIVDEASVEIVILDEPKDAAATRDGGAR